MSNSFENSRCSEVLDSALAKAGGLDAVNASGLLPLEARIITVLTIKMQVISMLNPDLSTPQLIAAFSLMHRGFIALIPELATVEGQKTYDKLAEVFTRDMKDLRSGKL